MANEQIICNGDCVAGQDYTPVEDTSIVLKYPDGEVTTSVPISFTIEEEQVPEESYLHTWSLPGAEACTGDTQWVSPEPVSSYTIEEAATTESINGSPDVEYFPNLSEVTIEWNGYTYTTTQPPVRYLLYDLYAHGLIFSQFDPAYAQMVATLDPNSTDYTTFQDSRGTIVVFHKAIDYARGGWGYTKDTTTLNSLQINAGFTIPPDGICRLNVPLVGASTLFFDFPDSNPSSGSTFTCPTMSNPNYGSWAYFVYDSTGLVQFEYRITSSISSLPSFTPVTITANPGIIVDWGDGDIDYLTGSTYTITKEQTIGGWWLQSYDYSQLFSGTVCRETPYLRLLGYDPYLNQCDFLTMSSNNIEDKYYDFELLRQRIAEEGDVWNYYYEPLLLPDASFYTIYSPTNYKYFSACQFWSYFLYPQNTGSLGASSDRVGFLDSKTEVPLSELNNFEDKTYVDAKFTYVTRAYTVVETDTGDISERYDEVFDGNAVAPDPTVSLGNGYALTFLPQGQTFTFGAECEPTNVVINQEDPNAPTTTAYKLTVFKEGTLVVEKTYETDPTPLISIVINSIKYILKIFGTDLKGNEIEQEYSFIDFDPTSIPGAFNITRLPYSELKINEGVCDLTINSPTYGEFSCVTTAPYTLPVESGPVNAIKLFDGDTQEWEVKYFDGSGNVLGTDTFQQEPIIQGNEFFGNDFVLAVDPLTGIEYVIPNPITIGGIEPTQTILPGTNLVVNGQEYTVSGIRLDPINPELIPPEVITPISRPVENTNLDFNFDDYTTGDLAFDVFNNWGSVLNTSTPTTTFTLEGQGIQNQIVLRIPPFDPNVNFSNLGDDTEPTPNNRPVINLNKQQPIVQCDCPDATKSRRYLSATDDKGLTVSWENSSAGAKQVLGITGCKHNYSVLIANDLERPYKPVDWQPDIVPNQYGTQPPIVGDDVSDYFDDDIGLPKEGFNMPRRRGRQQFL